jgi:hypothetical protein
LAGNTNLEKQMDSLLCARILCEVKRIHFANLRKGKEHEHSKADSPQGKKLLSLHSKPRSGCALRRGQVHRSCLTAVRAKRFVMAHE